MLGIYVFNLQIYFTFIKLHAFGNGAKDKNKLVCHGQKKGKKKKKKRPV